MATFAPTRLTLARRRRMLMKNRLAEMVGLTPRSITAYESGEAEPTSASIDALAAALRFPAEFFFRPEVEEIPVDGASFRSMASMTAGQRDAALSAGLLAFELSEWVDERFRLPASDVPRFESYQPEAAADALRARWGLGEKPIRNMVHLLEAKGVRVFSLAEQCLSVDAFSLWRAGHGFVFLNTMKSAEHGRFDAAHELGHLVLHGHGGPQGREAELEANAFASAFLMPRASVVAAVRNVVTVDALIHHKARWTVSVSALAHRLRKIDLLSEWSYRSLCIEINQRGYRTREPNGAPRETSEVFAKVFRAMKEEGVEKVDVARDLHVEPADLDVLVFGLALTALPGGKRAVRSPATPRSPLRLV